MPIYEYRCPRCGHEFEAWQKMSDAPIRVCPQCRGRKVEKLISRSSFHLKGSGWYITDYGRKPTHDGGKKASASDTAGKSNGAASASSSGSGDKSSSSDSAGGTTSSSKSDKGGTDGSPSGGDGGTKGRATSAQAA